MEAGGSRNTMVLGSVAICLAVLVGCVEVTKLSASPLLHPGPALGTHYRLPGVTDRPSWTVRGRLDSGETCSIGVGAAAGAGGDLYIVSRSAQGDIEAIWTSSGRSAASGTDCGNDKKVRLDAQDFTTLTAGFGLADPTPVMSYPSGF